MMNYGEFVLNAQIQKNDISCPCELLEQWKALDTGNLLRKHISKHSETGGGGATVIILIQIIRTIMCCRIYILA